MAEPSHSRCPLGAGQGRTTLVDGTVVGGYEVHFLSSGGMSVVYKGVKDGKTYALKEVDANHTTEVPSLLSEKSLLERLDHPGIINYRDLFQEDGFYYLVVDFVDGVPLADFLRADNRASLESIFDWGGQLCEVFSYLHNQDPPVIYRDLKCENVLMAKEQITLIDFGIARVHKGDRENDTELMGSAATASPEHFGGSETDARSDIYSIGATLYDLVSGGKRKRLGPFKFAPLEEFNSEVSPALNSVILKALSFEPENRQQSAQELLEDLTWAREHPKGDVESKETRSLKPVMAAFLACCALAVLGLAWTQLTKKPQGLMGEIFRAHDGVLTFGGEIGLLKLPPERADAIAKRLNELYHLECPSCGGWALEPGDVRVGRSSADGTMVVFYAHQEPNGEIPHGPEALTTVDRGTAMEAKVSERFVAAYWRDLLRDTVALSRGESQKPHQFSSLALGSTLGLPFSAAFRTHKGEDRSVSSVAVTVKAMLREAGETNPATLYKEVPDRRRPSLDHFENIEGYEALRN